MEITKEDRDTFKAGAQVFMDAFFEKLAHGDDEHRRWLKEAMDKEVDTLAEGVEAVATDAMEFTIMEVLSVLVPTPKDSNKKLETATEELHKTLAEAFPPEKTP